MTTRPCAPGRGPRREPDLDEARYYRSVVTGRLGDHRAALADLDRIVDRGFRPAYVYSDRGALHFRLGDLETALSDCRTAVELDPGLAFAHLNLACVLATTGRVDKAVEHFDIAARAGVPEARRLAEQVRAELGRR